MGYGNFYIKHITVPSIHRVQ